MQTFDVSSIFSCLYFIIDTIYFKTGSNQRLWECVRRRNFNTDTLNDLPVWLSTSVYY